VHSVHRLVAVGAAVAAIVASAPAAAQPVSRAQRRAIIARRIDAIFREKLRAPAPHGAHDADRQPDGALLRAPAEIGVSTDPGQEAELHAVVNPGDSNNILITAIRSNPDRIGLELPIYYTRDFGETWSASDFRPAASAGGDPVFAAASDGTIYFTWIELLQGQAAQVTENIRWTRSSDGGATWQEPDTVVRETLRYLGPGMMDGSFADKEWMAVDRSGGARDGALYVVFYLATMSGSSESASIVVRAKPSTTAPFGVETAVSDSTFTDVQFAGIGVDHVGDVHVFFWGSRTLDGRASLWHAVSHDGAASFEAPAIVGPVRFPSLEATAPDFLPQRLAPIPQFAVDGNPSSPHAGNLYAIWFSNDLASASAGTLAEAFHIYFARSTDGGTTWSEPRRINDDSVAFRADHFYPSIDVAPSGAVVLTWYDGRQSRNNADLHHYTAYSLDGGATFSRNIRVTSEPGTADAGVIGTFGLGDYTKCVSTGGYAIPVWVDGRSRDGDLDVYAAFLPMRDDASGIEAPRTVVASAELALAPNPAAGRSVLSLPIAHGGHARVEIFDASGRSVAVAFDGELAAGERDIAVDCAALPAGHYQVRVVAGTLRATAPLEIDR
jgi:hypothetical protein